MRLNTDATPPSSANPPKEREIYTDWYEMKGGRRHRFGKDLGEGLKLAAETLGDLFSLNDDGVATYAVFC